MPSIDLIRVLPIKSVVLISMLCSSIFPVYAEEQQVQPKEPDTHFDLYELRIKGNTLLDRTVLEKAVYPFLGPNKSIETVEKARQTLEKIYHDQGYQTIGVDIPEQNVQNGVVYLQVVEGKVSRLRVKDSRYFSLDSIKAAVPELAEGHVPNMPKMQQQLSALDGQSSDRKITPILRPGADPGTLDVDLKVKDNLPLHGSVAINGRNTASTSLLRLVSTLRYDNLWQKFHSASFTYQVSPEDENEVEVMVGTYTLPIFDNAAKLALYGVSSNSNAVVNAGAFSVLGKGEIWGARLIKPLKSRDGYYHSLVAGVDRKDFGEDLTTSDKQLASTKPISYLPFTLQYNGSLKGKQSFVSLNLGVNFSVRGVGNNQGEFQNKRVYAQSNYAVLLGGINFTHDLPYGMEFFSRFNGQVADSPLISNEQFSLGGMQTVRGYFETQALTDDGVVGSFEWRSPRLIPNNIDYINKLQALVFLDGGKGWTLKPQNTAATNELASTGMGLRMQIWKYFSGSLDVGFPLISLDKVQVGDPKIHFNVVSEF